MNGKDNVQNQIVENKQHPDYKTEIVQIFRSNLTPKIKQERILAYHQKDIASALELLSMEERSRLYHIFQGKALADILEYSENKTQYIGELSIQKRIAVLSQFEITEIVECLRQMNKADRTTIIELVGDELKRQIMLLNSFEEEEIASKMTTNYVTVPSGIGVKEAMRSLIEQAAENDNISTIYVLDGNEALLGAIDLKDLIIAREGTLVDTIAVTSYPYVYANELDRKSVV